MSKKFRVNVQTPTVAPWVLDLHRKGIRSNALTDTLQGMPGAEEKLLKEVQDFRALQEAKRAEQARQERVVQDKRRKEAEAEGDIKYQDYLNEMAERR